MGCGCIWGPVRAAGAAAAALERVRREPDGPAEAGLEGDVAAALRQLARADEALLQAFLFKNMQGCKLYFMISYIAAATGPRRRGHPPGTCGR